MTEAFESPSTLTTSSCSPNTNYSYSTDPNFLASFPENLNLIKDNVIVDTKTIIKN
ncbi:hypothetical protein [Flavobacterium sp. CS20]|uniref:hypothetical protein n=1 Tax=Flavobacterium sp. CS20 TaxID=2775246 RepID=UPI001B39D925|nr:hypothetical protein [Flavobacterium sp. CS20]QTY26585.1 hypothetical protein IGB25_11790 [Flavobacterium sp. CS20]